MPRSVAWRLYASARSEAAELQRHRGAVVDQDPEEPARVRCLRGHGDGEDRVRRPESARHHRLTCELEAPDRDAVDDRRGALRVVPELDRTREVLVQAAFAAEARPRDRRVAVPHAQRARALERELGEPRDLPVGDDRVRREVRQVRGERRAARRR